MRPIHLAVRRGLMLGLGVVATFPTVAHSQHAPTNPAPLPASGDSLRDPALIAGTLPNGMHYYVRANHAPADRAELRLVVNAGSVLEDDDQQGLAHFLEHMAFNGTAHFPGHKLIDFVETSGMRFGADLNAYTSYDETVYQLAVPTDDPKYLDQALTVIQDWADGGVTIDSGEVLAERGVVLGEWRSRLPDTASQAIQAHYDSVNYGDTRYRTRRPIGLPRLVTSAEPAPIRRFYHDWYRPDLMAIVAVGDFDPKQMEREIRKRFGKIPEPASPRPRIDQLVPSSNETVVDVYRARLSPQVEVLWRMPPHPVATVAAYRQQLIQDLLVQHLQRQLLRTQAEVSRPFITATTEVGQLVRGVNVVGVGLLAWPDSLERGLTSVLTEFERVAQHGVPAVALARQKALILQQLEHAAASEAARPSGVYANEYSQHYLTKEGLLLSAEQEVALARELLPQITPEVLAEAARFWRRPEGRTVLVRLPNIPGFRPPTRESVLAVMDSVARTPLAPDSARVMAEGPLMQHTPTPGRIVSERQDKKAGITEWTLSNGARVLLKPTQNDPDQLVMRAWSPGGFSRVPDSLFFGPGRMAAKVMTEAGGLGRLNHDELLQNLAQTGVRQFEVNIGYADESIQLAGSPKELETLFQTLYLQFTTPKLDSAALASWQSLAKYGRASPSFDDQLDQVFARGNARMLPVSTQLAELAHVKQVLAVYHNRFGNAGDFTFTLVGAVSPKAVRPFVERYLASLPSTAEREQPEDPNARPFFEPVRVTRKLLELPKATTVWVYDGLVPTDSAKYLRSRQELGALAQVLNRRLRNRLREELSGTYGVGVRARSYLLPPEHYRLMFIFDAAPDRVDELDRAFMAVLDTVRKEKVPAEELHMVTRIQDQLLKTDLQDNDYWVSMIGLYHRLGIPLDKIVAPYEGHQLTPSELQAAAQRDLPENLYIHLTLLPKDTTYYASDSAEQAPTNATAKVASGSSSSSRNHTAMPKSSNSFPKRDGTESP
jgi:zinc protease